MKTLEMLVIIGTCMPTNTINGHKESSYLKHSYIYYVIKL